MLARRDVAGVYCDTLALLPAGLDIGDDESASSTDSRAGVGGGARRFVWERGAGRGGWDDGGGGGVAFRRGGKGSSGGGGKLSVGGVGGTRGGGRRRLNLLLSVSGGPATPCGGVTAEELLGVSSIRGIIGDGRRGEGGKWRICGGNEASVLGALGFAAACSRLAMLEGAFRNSVIRLRAAFSPLDAVVGVVIDNEWELVSGAGKGREKSGLCIKDSRNLFPASKRLEFASSTNALFLSAGRAEVGLDGSQVPSDGASSVNLSSIIEEPRAWEGTTMPLTRSDVTLSSLLRIPSRFFGAFPALVPAGLSAPPQVSAPPKGRGGGGGLTCSLGS